MKSEQELLAFFESGLKQEFDPLEEFRIREVSKFKKYMIFAACSLLFPVLAVPTFLMAAIFISFIPLLFFLGFAYYTLKYMLNTLTRAYKKNIFPKILHFLFTDFEYIENQKIAKTVFQKSMLFPYEIAVVEGEDFMRFKFGETSIMFCEAAVLINSEIPKFHGIFMSVTYNKYFTSKTFVLPRQKGFLLKRIREVFAYYNCAKVKLEDVEFSKSFHVLSSDQVEARYILTPAMMQRILIYSNKLEKKVSFSFVDNHLYCAIPNAANLFEPPLFDPFDFEFMKKNYLPLKLFTDLVEDLNLNLRIWTKN